MHDSGVSDTVGGSFWGEDSGGRTLEVEKAGTGEVVGEDGAKNDGDTGWSEGMPTVGKGEGEIETGSNEGDEDGLTPDGSGVWTAEKFDGVVSGGEEPVEHTFPCLVYPEENL